MTIFAATAEAVRPPRHTVPRVTIDSPAAGTTISSKVTVAGTAADRDGIASVKLSIDGGTAQPVSGTTSWTFAFDTTSVVDGSHTITATATDNVGQVGAVQIGVTVSNAAPATPTPSPTPPSTTPQCPSGATAIPAGASIQSYLTAGAQGEAFCLAAATYRQSTALTPRADQQIYGQAGTVLSGARVITGWTYDSASGSWFHTGDTSAPTSLSGNCADTTEACKYPDDVWRNGVRLSRVLSSSQLVPGKVYVDYAANRIHVKDDPTTATMELSVAPQAVVANGNNSGTAGVTLAGLVVEKFANRAQTPAIQMGPSWLVDSLDIRNNHGVGIESGGHSILRNSHIHHQGQLGLSGCSTTGALVENNEIDHNNTAGFDWGWEGGGSKWAFTTSLTVRGNNVHDNDGPGLWTDGNNVYTLFENNTVTNNSGAGIFHEISYDAVIRYNTVKNNSTATAGKSIWWGSDIHLNDSQNVEIYGNTVYSVVNGIGMVDVDRGSGPRGAYQIANDYVHDNDVTLGSAARVGLVGRSTAFSSNNRFLANHYHLPSLTGSFWQWTSTATKDQWQGYGQDTTGTFAVQ
jgi:parallel beta-helix repeat protein